MTQTQAAANILQRLDEATAALRGVHVSNATVRERLIQEVQALAFAYGQVRP